MPIYAADKYSLDQTGATDNSPGLVRMAADIAALYAAGKPLPRILFPEGTYRFTTWPNLAYPNLEIVAEGEVRLISGGSIVFDASILHPGVDQPGIDNFRFDGFHIYPVNLGVTALVFRGVHRSDLRAHVYGPALWMAPAAIQMTFCIITSLRPRISSGGAATGVLIDAWPGHPNWQSTASVIHDPCIETCNIGLDMQSAGSCAVYNGTIEGCGTGVHLGAASGNNMFYSVEMEGNGKDVRADSGAHTNGFLYCGNDSKLTTNFGLFDSNWAQH